MGDEGLEVFAFDELEEFEAGAIQEVIPRHCLKDYVEYWCEVVFLDELLVVEFVLQTNALSKEF